MPQIKPAEEFGKVASNSRVLRFKAKWFETRG